jgi:hypothetical protein
MGQLLDTALVTSAMTPDTSHCPNLGSEHQPEGQMNHMLTLLACTGGGCPRVPPDALGP